MKKFLFFKNKVFVNYFLIFLSFYFFYLKVTAKDHKQIFKPEEKGLGRENFLLSELNWESYHEKFEDGKLKWEKVNEKELERIFKDTTLDKKHTTTINSLNRSIVFNEKIPGPDISWIVPPGFSWNSKYKFDFHTRGHNTQIPDPPKKKFFGWNNGDAVGLISYQFLHLNRASFGVNLGVRSLYEGNQAMGGNTAFGEGLSGGFRWDYELSDTSGIAFGAEQLFHFDSLTDTGRNIYLTISKGWWSSESENFPLDIATTGIGTGRMAVGTIKGFCNDILDGSGTEGSIRRDLCWSPIFSLARVWNQNLSTFFEYNSRFFILGSSIAPFESIPIRGTFGLILSDHIDNYKFHNKDEMNWVFNVSLGF